MRRRIAMSCLVLLALAACIVSNPPAMAEDVSPGAQISVVRDGALWTADYELQRDAPVWAFYRSSLTNGSRQPWRTRDWRVVTPGVVLERIGDLDILRAADGGDVPRHVRLELTPRPDNLEADYPVLIFTDGSVAMPTGAFDVFPMPSLDAVRLPADEVRVFKGLVGNARITWRDAAGPVLFHGHRREEAVAEDGNTYVLFGQTRMNEGERLVTVVDPELPAWITASIEDFAPRIAD